VCILAWNIGFPAFVYIESEAVAVNIASNEHGHIKDADARWAEMEKIIHSQRDRRWPYFNLLAVSAGGNVIMAAIALVVVYRSKSAIN